MVGAAVPASALGAATFGREAATFRVVVEGSGVANRLVDGDGTNGVCQVSASTNSGETYEYFRGKGVTVMVTRFKGIPKSPLIMRRLGQRSFRPTFNVQGWYQGSADGFARRDGPASCLPVNEKVGDETECNRKIRRGVEMALNLAGGKLVLELADQELTRLPGKGCGSNAVETMSGWPLLGWGGFPELEPEPLAPGLVFGRKNSFVIRYTGDDSELVDSPNPVFLGRAREFGQHDAVVRFVRLTQ